MMITRILYEMKHMKAVKSYEMKRYEVKQNLRKPLIYRKV